MNQLSLKITQGISATLIIIRVRIWVSNTQPKLTWGGPPSARPMSSTQVRINAEPGRGLPAEMPACEIESEPRSGELGSASRSMESPTTVTV